jgi:hypothetical protein
MLVSSLVRTHHATLFERGVECCGFSPNGRKHRGLHVCRCDIQVVRIIGGYDHQQIGNVFWTTNPPLFRISFRRRIRGVAERRGTYMEAIDERSREALDLARTRQLREPGCAEGDVDPSGFQSRGVYAFCSPEVFKLAVVRQNLGQRGDSRKDVPKPTLGTRNVVDRNKEKHLVIFPEASQAVPLNVGRLKRIFRQRGDAN